MGLQCITKSKGLLGVPSLEKLNEVNDGFIKEGYEGTILRSPSGLYKYGRSTVKEAYLLKMKIFQDEEFEVVGFIEMNHNRNEATKDALGNTERSSHRENMIPSGTL